VRDKKTFTGCSMAETS